jgi:Methyltransferase domain
MLKFRTLLNNLNTLLSPFNLYIDTLTAKKIERARLSKLEQEGYFQSPVFDIPLGFKSSLFQEILDNLNLYQTELANLADPSLNSSGYSYDNGFFTSPDAEVLYCIIRTFMPRTVLEVGCGNSTRIIRQAILDGNLSSQLISIDPSPREDIIGLADRCHLVPVESLSKQDLELFSSLETGDILFIDSSHSLKTGNDVAFLYTQVIPKLNTGVIVHIHDIFLPYDYPKTWVIDEYREWNEQYLVHCMLTMNSIFEVIWAGYFLQKNYPDFQKFFPHLDGRSAQSLWLRKI